MLVKQFRTGYEAKCYLILLKKKYDEEVEEQFESFETRGVEYGYVLGKATKEIENIELVDFEKLLNHKVEYSDEEIDYLNQNEEKLKGGTIKFKLSDEASEKIDTLTTYLSDKLNMRLYRAFTVKLLLKNLYLRKIQNTHF